MNNLLAVSAACLVVCNSGTRFVTAGDSWPSFQNGGHPVAALQPSATVKLGERFQWTAQLPGYGQSTPVTLNDHIYVTSIEGDQKQQAHVSAFHLKDGASLWKHTLVNATLQENNTYVSKAAPTPAADADGVICLFEGGNVVALTHAG